MVGGTREALEALERDLEEGGDHDDGENEDPDRFEAAAADGIGILVLLGDEFCRSPDDGGAEEVKNCVNKRSEDGQRACEDDDGDFAGEEHRVGGKIDIDGYRDHAAAALGLLVVLHLKIVCFWAVCPSVHISKQGSIFIPIGKLVQSLWCSLNPDLCAITVFCGLIDCVQG